jgi:acetyl esterase/lipase
MRTLRRLVPALVVVAVLATTAAGCDWPEGTRYVHPVFTSVTTTKDIPYRTTTDYQGNPITLKLDVYRPQGDTVTNRPAVIWGFGGAWMAGNKDQLGPYATDSAKRGYVGITIDYRIRSQAGPVLDMAGDAYDDTMAAVEFVKAHAAEYGINPDAIVAAGYSAGAINSLNAAFWPGERGPATSPVAGAVAIAGFTFGKPVQGDPPILMFHGDSDRIVPYGTGKSTCQATKDVGNSCRFYTYPGLGHEIGATQAQSIMERTADWIFEIVLLPLGYKA